jgi:hypothetical protein
MAILYAQGDESAVQRSAKYLDGGVRNFSAANHTDYELCPRLRKICIDGLRESLTRPSALLYQTVCPLGLFPRNFRLAIGVENRKDVPASIR